MVKPKNALNEKVVGIHLPPFPFWSVNTQWTWLEMVGDSDSVHTQYPLVHHSLGTKVEYQHENVEG